MHVDLGLGHPFSEALGDEGDARGEEEDAAPAAAALVYEALHELEGGEGFAGAAGHDEFAAVFGFKAAHDVVDGEFLVGARGVGRPQDFLFSAHEFFPVDGVVVELGEADALAGEAVFFDGVAELGVPLVRGGDDHAAGKVDATVFSPVHADAGVVGAEVFEAEDVLRGVTFALDGAVVSAGGFLGDEVDALILPSVAVGPVHPEPYLREAFAKDGLLLQEAQAEFFKAGAFLLLGVAFAQLPELVEDGGEGGVGHARHSTT